MLQHWADIAVQISFTVAISVLSYLFVKELRNRVKLEFRVMKLELNLLTLTLSVMGHKDLDADFVESLIGEVGKTAPKPTIH